MDHMTLSYDIIEFVAMNNDFFEALSSISKSFWTRLRVEQQFATRSMLKRRIVDEMRGLMTVVELSDEERKQWVDATSQWQLSLMMLAITAKVISAPACNL